MHQFPNMSTPHGNTEQWHREVLHCLEDKVIGRPLPSSFDEGIHLDDLFKYRPDDLPGVPDKGEKRLYFTAPIWVNRVHGARKRSSEFGRWHARDKQEIRDLQGRLLGFVRRLIYMQGRFPERRTKWAMLEHALHPIRIPPGVNELVLCIIYKTKDRNTNRSGMTSGNAGPSNNPSSEPVSQAENQEAELTDLPFSDWSASMEFPSDPVMDWSPNLFASMAFPRDPIKYWENDLCFETYYRDI